MRRSYTASRGGVGIWSAVAVLLVLLSFSAYLISSRIGNLLPGERDVISITYDRPSMNVGGENGDDWAVGSRVGIFGALYENERGEVIAESDGGDAIIAPGTSRFYRFYVKNDGNVALDFSLRVLPSFRIDGAESEEIPIPISFRISDQDGNYLFGGRNEWVSAQELASLAAAEDSYIKLKSVVGVHSYYAYLLEWRWDFEGNDALDTLLGQGAVTSEMKLWLDISTSTVESEDPKAVGGKRDGDVSGIDWEIRQVSNVVFAISALCAVGAIIMAVYQAGFIDDDRARNGKNRPPRLYDL